MDISEVGSERTTENLCWLLRTGRVLGFGMGLRDQAAKRLEDQATEIARLRQVIKAYAEHHGMDQCQG